MYPIKAPLSDRPAENSSCPKPQASLPKNLSHKKQRIVGIFSLVAIFFMGIFYTPPLIAVTESLSVSVSNIYNASFSFNLAPFVSRRHIVPDRVFFNASGTPQEFPTSTTPQSFTQWHTTYHPATWQDPWKSADLASGSTFSYPQILQLPQTLTANLPARTVLIAAMNLASSFDISLRAYTTEANLLTSPAAGFPMIISSPGILKPFSMLYSDGKVFFFYVNFSDSRIHMKTYDG
ncbi:MAG TPA: hypothetical protein PLR50_07025, partial [Candidatus Rifleibacterium sp.]|nr:hypothetical protein [Candidatus Rifleibacterium sp.]